MKADENDPKYWHSTKYRNLHAAKYNNWGFEYNTLSKPPFKYWRKQLSYKGGPCWGDTSGDGARAEAFSFVFTLELKEQ
jgi:hypothetical protein